jgi:hypothetical protein
MASKMAGQSAGKTRRSGGQQNRQQKTDLQTARSSANERAARFEIYRAIGL